MGYMRKRYSMLFAVLALFFSCITARAETESAGGLTKDVKILFTSDVH